MPPPSVTRSSLKLKTTPARQREKLKSEMLLFKEVLTGDTRPDVSFALRIFRRGKSQSQKSSVGRGLPNHLVAFL